MTDKQGDSLASSLRKVAAELRQQGDETETAKKEKCAHIIIAAHGLSRLKQRILGGQDG